MTTTIITKNSSVAGVSPRATELSFGELAINYADGKLFYKDGNSTIKYFDSKPDFGTVKSVDIDPGQTGLEFTGGPITTSGTFSVGGILNVQHGGTGATSPNGAINNLLPAQSKATTTNKLLGSDGTNVVWRSITSADVTAGLQYVPVNITGDIMQGPLTLHGAPTSSLHAATKQYVDNVASGFNVRVSCVAATTTNLTATYNNGSNGIGATLTGTGSFPPLDGITVKVDDRVLVKNQTDKTQNGIYIVANITGNWVLTRASDFDNSTNGVIKTGDFTYLQKGVSQRNTQWIMISTGLITLGTSEIEWTQFGAAAQYSAGTGISLADDVITNTGVTQINNGQNILVSQTTGNVTVSFTGVLPVENGGTGAESPSAAINNLLPSQATNENGFLTTDGDNVSWTTDIPIGIASSSVLGGVKIGSNINVASDGTISVAAVFSGNYSDLLNAPTTLSYFNNDANFITLSSLTWDNISGKPTAVSYFTNDAGYTVQADLTWDKLSGKPTAVSYFTNDAGYTVLEDITWENLSGDAPSVSYFTNDVGYITNASFTWDSISGKPTAVSYFTNDAGYAVISDIKWENLSGDAPSVSYFTNDAGYITTTSLTWNNISGTPENVSYFNNDAGYVTALSLTWDSISSKPTAVSYFTNDIGYTVLADIRWDNLTGNIPAISYFTNDTGYITDASLTWTNITSKPTVVSYFTNDAGYTVLADIKWDNLTGNIPAISYFTNDVGYITNASFTWDSISGKPTAVSYFTNDAGYTVLADITWDNLTGNIPSVSYFTNDAGYITVTSLTWDNISDKPPLSDVALSGNLGDLTNVDLTTNSPSNNQVLAYDSVTEKWVPKTSSGMIEKISDISDVNATEPISNGSLLVYNSTTSKWDVTTELDGGIFT
jgi:hypothetical protein